MKSFSMISKQIYTFLNRAICVSSPPQKLKDISASLRSYVNSLSGLNRNEKGHIYQEAMRLARAAVSAKRLDRSPMSVLGVSENLRRLVVAVRKSLMSFRLRQKKNEVKRFLKDEDTVFFLCSSHTSPALDHKDYQGRVYIDRFWRKKVQGFMYYAVMSYIKNHKCLSVQESMTGPPYLCTRPYCKHYFIPLRTTEVLHTSVRKLNERIGKVKDKEYDYSEFEKLRKKIFQTLNNDMDCSEYRRWF